MSLTNGAFTVHLILQNIIPPPYYVGHQSQQLIKSPLYSKPYRKIFRYFSQFSIWLVLPMAAFRLSWLLVHWKTYTKYNVEQVIVYGLGVCVILIYLPLGILFLTEFVAIISTINQSCQLKPMKSQKTLTCPKLNLPFLGKKSFFEIFVYCLAIPFIFIPPAFFIASFAMAYLPFQLIFGNTFPVKLGSGVVYGLVVTFGASNVLSTFLLIIVFLENIIKYTETLCEEKVLVSNIQTRRHFKLSCCRFRNSRIVFKFFNILYSPFLTNLIFVGVLLATCGSYMTIKMYGKIHIVTYLVGPALASLCFVIALLLTYLSHVPHKRSKNLGSFGHFTFGKGRTRNYYKAVVHLV